MSERYQLLRPLNKRERDDLKASIAKRGVQQPIFVDEEGRILDGHHRQEIADELNLPCPRVVVTGLDDEEKRQFVLEMNEARRHLGSADKRQLITEKLQQEPGRSNREIAAEVGVDHHTVGSERRDRLINGEIPHLLASAPGRRPEPSKDYDVKTREMYKRIDRAFTEGEKAKLEAAKVPVLHRDKLASLRRENNPIKCPELVQAVLNEPVEEIRATITRLKLMDKKEGSKTNAGKRKRILSDIEERQASLARQTEEQRRARLEAGQMIEVDRLMERVMRLTFRSCVEKLIAATTAHLERLEGNESATVTGSNGHRPDSRSGIVLAERSSV